MAENAHFRTAGSGGVPVLTVRDDRGVPMRELELPHGVTNTAQADDELRAAGFVRSADWTETDDGWVAPVKSDNSA